MLPAADPGFPVGGRQLPRRLRFENFVCQNERIWTLRGWGACRRHPPGSATGYTFYFVMKLSLFFRLNLPIPEPVEYMVFDQFGKMSIYEPGMKLRVWYIPQTKTAEEAEMEELQENQSAGGSNL